MCKSWVQIRGQADVVRVRQFVDGEMDSIHWGIVCEVEIVNSYGKRLQQISGDNLVQKLENINY